MRRSGKPKKKRNGKRKKKPKNVLPRKKPAEKLPKRLLRSNRHSKIPAAVIQHLHRQQAHLPFLHRQPQRTIPVLRSGGRVRGIITSRPGLHGAGASSTRALTLRRATALMSSPPVPGQSSRAITAALTIMARVPTAAATGTVTMSSSCTMTGRIPRCTGICRALSFRSARM